MDLSSLNDFLKADEGLNHERAISVFEQYLSKWSSPVVLEVGSGSGNDFLLLNQRFSAFCSDANPHVYQYLSNRFAGKSLQIDITLPIAISKRFQGIYCAKVLHLITASARKTALLNLAQYLEPNGVLCVVAWNPIYFKEAHHLTVIELEAWLTSAKLKLIHKEAFKQISANDSYFWIATKAA